MKSLSESLFDSNLASKDLTFGDLFELESYNIVKNIHARGEYQDLSKSFSPLRVKKASGVSGSDKNETIYKGLVKIIQNIKLDGDPEEMDRKWVEDRLREIVNDLFQYSLTFKSFYTGFFSSNDGLLIGDGFTLFTKKLYYIKICLGPDLTLLFKRK